jgi:hemerythrin-like domain-containing protein
MTVATHPYPSATGDNSADAFRRPLEVIRGDHDWQEGLCEQLNTLAQDQGTQSITEWAPALVTYLTKHLPLHTQDEELDLFPMLERRCAVEDGLGEVLAQLSREHALDQDLADFLASDLEPIAGGMTAAPPLRFFINARAFSETQQRHLTWENRVILPLAKRRLEPSDLETLGRNMAERRGLAFPE